MKNLETINEKALQEVVGGTKIKELDKSHQEMLKFLMQKMDADSFHELLVGIGKADPDEARRLIELPYFVHTGH